MTQYKYVQEKGLKFIYTVKFYHIKKKYPHYRLVQQSLKVLEW
jgi:hypothetical protein